MKGYKVVRRHNGELISAYSWSTRGVVTYSSTYRTHRNIGCGPLAVCSTLAAASDLLSPELEIWECEYGPSKDTGLWINPGPKASADFLNDDIIFADWVRLTKYVKAW